MSRFTIVLGIEVSHSASVRQENRDIKTVGEDGMDGVGENHYKIRRT